MIKLSLDSALSKVTKANTNDLIDGTDVRLYKFLIDGTDEPTNKLKDEPKVVLSLLTAAVEVLKAELTNKPAVVAFTADKSNESMIKLFDRISNRLKFPGYILAKSTTPGGYKEYAYISNEYLNKAKDL